MPLPAHAEDIVLKEDFDSNANGWSEANTAVAEYKIEEGKYFIELKQDAGATYNTIVIPLDESRDFSIESTMTKLSGGDDCLYGLTWGRGAGNYYVFEINGKGAVTVQKYVDGRFLEVVTKSKTPHVRKGKSKNELAIHKINGRLNFFVNGQLVAELPHMEFFGNRVGFVVGRKQRIEIENIIVSQSPGPAAPEALKLILDNLSSSLLKDFEERSTALAQKDGVRVAFTGFENDETRIYTNIFFSSIQEYWRPPQYRLYTRDQLDKIMEEQSLHLTGVIDESTTSRLGMIMGVDFLISGELSGRDEESIVLAQIYRLADGEVIASRTATAVGAP